MIEFFNHSIWEFFAAIIGVVVPIIILIKKKNKIFGYTYNIIDVITEKIKIEKLNILYDNIEMENFSISKIKIFNAGSVDISEKDFLTNIRIFFGQKTEIFNIEISDKNDDMIDVNYKFHNNVIEMDPFYLKKKDCIELTVWITDLNIKEWMELIEWIPDLNKKDCIELIEWIKEDNNKFEIKTRIKKDGKVRYYDKYPLSIFFKILDIMAYSGFLLMIASSFYIGYNSLTGNIEFVTSSNYYKILYIMMIGFVLMMIPVFFRFDQHKRN